MFADCGTAAGYYPLFSFPGISSKGNGGSGASGKAGHRAYPSISDQMNGKTAWQQSAGDRQSARGAMGEGAGIIGNAAGRNERRE